MDPIPNHPLIIVTLDDIKKARQFYDLNDPKRIKESIDTVREWLKKQDHLAAASQYLSDNMLERIFILARGSVEGTKTKLDRLLTLRSMMPELSLNRTVKEFEQFWGAVSYLPLPKLNKIDQSRVCLTQVLTEKLDQFDLLSYFRYCFVVGEYRLHFDYSISERYVIDMKNIHVGHLRKLNPVVMKKSEVLCTEGFGTKIKGIHILNAPSFVDRILLILKQALKEKVASRIHVHSTYKDLHKHIPKEILPSDYDGDGPSCAKLAEQWRETFRTQEAQDIIKNLDHLVADESKRQSAKFNEEYLGMPGSFRKLDVD